MLPHLRRIGSCFFLTMAVLAAALWVRSYRYTDTLEAMHFWRTERAKSIVPADTYTFYSARGVLRFRHLTGPSRGELAWKFSYRISEALGLARNHMYGFACRQTPLVSPGKPWSSATPPPLSTFVAVPHWFPMLLTVALAVAIRSKPRFQVGLRLLVAITAAFAVALTIALSIGPN